jgi:hypothetical protein
VRIGFEPTYDGFVVQFGTHLPNAAPPIGQFFPVSGPGVLNLTQDLIDAFRKIVG